MDYTTKQIRDICEAATRFACQFGVSVFPLRANDKKPRGPWKEFQTRFAGRDEIKSWRAMNIGIVTGKLSNLVVVDCESRGDGEWFWTCRGKSPTVVKTRRGIHLYFRHPGQRVKNATHVLDENGVSRYDVRGDGGFVVAPPSVVPEHTYRFLTPLLPTYRLPVFDMRWLPPDPTGHVGSGHSVTDGVRYIQHIKAIAGQGGHNDTFRAVCRLRDSGLDVIEATAAMVQWNQTNADPPWSGGELTHKIRSVYG